MVSASNLSYDCSVKTGTRTRRTAAENSDDLRGNASLPAPSRRDETEEQMGMQVLLLAAGVLAAVWIVVLWGSRYFGPR